MNNLFEIFKPLYYLLKIFGQANYNFDWDSEDKKVLSCKITKLYSIFLLILVTMSVVALQSNTMVPKSNKEQLLYLMFLHMNITLTGIILTNNLFYNEKMIDILNRLLILDKKFKRNSIPIQNRNDRNVIRKVLLFQIVLVLLFYICGNYRQRTEISSLKIFLSFGFFIRKSIQSMAWIQIEMFMILMKTRSNALRYYLLEKSSSMFNTGCKSLILARIAEFHQEINMILRDIQDFSSVPMVFSIILSFMISLVLGYDIILQFLHPMDCIVVMYNIVAHVTFFVIFVYYCSTTVYSVSIIFSH